MGLDKITQVINEAKSTPIQVPKTSIGEQLSGDIPGMTIDDVTVKLNQMGIDTTTMRAKTSSDSELADGAKPSTNQADNVIVEGKNSIQGMKQTIEQGVAAAKPPSSIEAAERANSSQGLTKTVVTETPKGDVLAVCDLPRNPHSKVLFDTYAKETLDKSGQGWTAESNKLIVENMLKDGRSPQRIVDSLKHSPEPMGNAYYFVKELRNTPEIQQMQQSKYAGRSL